MVKLCLIILILPRLLFGEYINSFFFLFECGSFCVMIFLCDLYVTENGIHYDVTWQLVYFDGLTCSSIVTRERQFNQSNFYFFSRLINLILYTYDKHYYLLGLQNEQLRSYKILTGLIGHIRIKNQDIT